MFHGLHTHAHADDAAPKTKGVTIRWASHYDLVVNVLLLGRARRFREMTVDLAHVRPGEAVLDVGCGTGELTLAAKRRVGSQGAVHGIDAAPEMIAFARGKAHRQGVDVDFRPGVVEKLPFPDASFDVVLSSLMVHHLPDDLKREGLAEIRRVLKPGGRLLVVDMKRPTGFVSRALTGLMLHRKMGFGVQDLPALMRDAGFTEVETGNTKFTVVGYARGRAG
jgi:demethylmenaquinone methyltransferase/2-methoxy-6-polyprenyl-1,4-benzoquinol methylase/phosphoethanolamine N-methyltransferase